MGFTDLSFWAYLFVAWLVYKIVWAYFGESVLVRLYPEHYSVWAGTKPPPSTGLWQQLQFIRKAMALAKADGDLFDDIICPGFERDGNTVERSDFETGTVRRGALFPVLGNSIFTSDGSFWEHSRALFRPQFSRDNINDLAATGKASDALIAACGYTGADGWTGEVKLSPLFYNFTLDTATDFLFGESLNSQDTAIAQARGEPVGSGDSVSTSEQFYSSLDLINTKVITRFRLGPMYWLGDGFEFRKAANFIKSWTEKYAQLALRATDSATDKGKKSNVLSTLATQCKDVSELRNQTLAILFAGRDTTASLLGWMFIRLALNPEIYQKLRKIVLADFPAGSEITFTGLKSCRYLQHVVNESLRLHPTVPFNARVATRDTTLPVGGGPDGKSPIAIRKGQTIAFIVYAMHRRKDLFGEDADEFRPERFEQRIPAWQFLPFLGGPRICLGQQFALTEASYVLVRMAQHFDKIEPVDFEEMSKMRKTIGVTMSVRDGVRVRLHKADAA
ncbi:hypothetical protein AMS68_002588 [Peltaster fructicola]|uniref:Cytochrome P450 n=1 Tax=Peltaster fructicola TaxID=286661 RepID=A0A6H0XQZ2_9PEZI|nr:hypothetical protein AMS68_002588 [Peltaster fructicola]